MQAILIGLGVCECKSSFSDVKQIYTTKNIRISNFGFICKSVLCSFEPWFYLQWKAVFSERFRLRNNWLGGRCNVRTFEGHTQGVSCVQFDDTRIVSGSSDKTIKVNTPHHPPPILHPPPTLHPPTTPRRVVRAVRRHEDRQRIIRQNHQGKYTTPPTLTRHTQTTPHPHPSHPDNTHPEMSTLVELVSSCFWSIVVSLVHQIIFVSLLFALSEL